MGCILWLSAQEVKTENFSINVGENHIDSLATVVSKSEAGKRGTTDLGAHDAIIAHAAKIKQNFFIAFI